MISIKHRHSGTTLCEFNVETIKEAVEKGKANLLGANLREADLCGANLLEAIIDGETVSKNPIHIPCGLKYIALITDGYMRLGCKRYKHSEWAAFSDEQISEMDDGALEFWKQWKEPLLAMCKVRAG